jgi:hypothetical protein
VEDALPPGKSRAELDAAIETTISRVWSQIKEARARRLTMPGTWGPSVPSAVSCFLPLSQVLCTQGLTAGSLVEDEIRFPVQGR